VFLVQTPIFGLGPGQNQGIRLRGKMTAKLPEMRKDRRYRAALPVFLGKDMGATRDMSQSGVYFWKDGMCLSLPGEPISFAIELDTATGRMMWKCQGEVVRTERLGEMIGVAVSITDSAMEPLWADTKRTTGIGDLC
jgi:hypothetical protein